jgi:hypothetical protein
MVLLDGRQRAPELRGLQARALLAFLVFERHRTVDRFDACRGGGGAAGLAIESSSRDRE